MESYQACLAFLLALNFILPPYLCTITCNFVYVYMIRYRVHVHISSKYNGMIEQFPVINVIFTLNFMEI